MDRPGTPSWRRDQARELLDFGRRSALPDGGFGWLDVRGGIEPGSSRPIFITARMTYCFALAVLDGDDERDHRLAASGVATLLDRYLDPEHGGWITALDADGEVEDTTKANYAHAHVLLASATATAAGVPRAPELLERAIAVIERQFWSDDEGAAVENWDATFTTLEPYRGANSNMHSVEAYLVAGDVTGNPVWHDRALAIAERVVDRHARAHGWRIPEHFDADWRPLLDYNLDNPTDRFRPYGFTPGHSFEWTRLLLALEASLTDPPPWLVGAATNLFDVAVRSAWAPDAHPGFVYTLGPDDRPIVAERLHWVACEAVLAAHSLHARTADRRYADDAQRWWEHIAEHFIDPVNGGWWQELGPDLQPTATIWPGKPDLYHCYQALLLPALPLAPCAAVALGRAGG